MGDSEPSAAARLLLLDDDAGILRLERRRLEAAGYAVNAVQSAAAAREAILAGSYALLVLDYRLEGGLSGLEFYQQMRAEGHDVPAILVTAFSDENKLFEALRAGVRDVLPKSGEYLDYLPQAVDRVMAQIRAEREAVEAEALRRSEERLRALNAELERSERQLRAQAEQLAEANRGKDEFLATLAHELRNPLAPIRFALSLLGDLSPDQARARDVIERQLLHLVRLVDDLLDIARLTRNKIQLRVERIQLAPVMRAAVESVAPQMTAAGHELSVVPAPDSAWVDGDAARLTQVFTNLLNNAAKYTPNGGRIRFEAAIEGGKVRVSVYDNGVGIGTTDLPRVFDTFYQSVENRPQVIGGLGIGLMIVKRVVEMHGGTVEAHSGGRGQGSQFVVSLPLVAAADAAGPTVDDERVPARPASLRVLVVDDNQDSADLLAMVVEQSGHSTRIAHDGEQAFEEFRSFHPDVALLDIGLPRISGYEVARRFRQESNRPLFLVAITGWGQDDDRKRAREAGFDCHLVKPADPTLLARLLECVAGGRPCDVCPRCLAAARSRA